MNAAFAPISNAKTILLTTYKRDGTPVATASRPVWPPAPWPAGTGSFKPSWCRPPTA
jgi:hypothetical protein